MSTPNLIFILVPSRCLSLPTAATTTKGGTRQSLSEIATSESARDVIRFLSGPNRSGGVSPVRCHDQQARSPTGFDRSAATADRRRTRPTLRSQLHHSTTIEPRLTMNVGHDPLHGHAPGGEPGDCS